LVKKKDAASKAVRQVERQVRDIRARSKALLKSAQLDVRNYRKQLSTLKKQEVVSKRIDARTHQPTRYMLRKIKKFKGVALGHELAVPIDKMSMHRAREYTQKGIADRVGKFLIVPKTAAKQKADVYKGHIRTTTQLDRGEFAEIKYPARIEDMHDILEWLAENEETLNELKGPRDQFGFQLSGHNSRQGLANVRELIAYLMQYDGTNPKDRGNIFKGKKSVQEFVIFRFRPEKGKNKPNLDPYYGTKRYTKLKDRKDERRGANYKREKERERKARQRMSEGNKEHDARLEKQRQYDRARSNARREARMGKKLMGD
jgi:hypothetical protein